jgi:hypothetical protein
VIDVVSKNQVGHLAIPVDVSRRYAQVVLDSPFDREITRPLSQTVLNWRRPQDAHAPKGLECVIKDRKQGLGLFVSQRDDRSDADRAPRWDITSKQSDSDEKKRDTSKRERISWPHVVEESSH